MHAGNIAAINALPDRSRILLVTDDVEPSVLVQGHLSLILQAAVSPVLRRRRRGQARPFGRPGISACATWAASHPATRADWLVLDGLDAFPPRQVAVSGSVVAQEGNISHRRHARRSRCRPIPLCPPISPQRIFALTPDPVTRVSWRMPS